MTRTERVAVLLLAERVHGNDARDKADAAKRPLLPGAPWLDAAVDVAAGLPAGRAQAIVAYLRDWTVEELRAASSTETAFLNELVGPVRTYEALARSLREKVTPVAAGGRTATAFLCAAHAQALSAERALPATQTPIRRSSTDHPKGVTFSCNLGRSSIASPSPIP